MRSIPKMFQLSLISQRYLRFKPKPARHGVYYRWEREKRKNGQIFGHSCWPSRICIRMLLTYSSYQFFRLAKGRRGRGDVPPAPSLAFERGRLRLKIDRGLNQVYASKSTLICVKSSTFSLPLSAQTLPQCCDKISLSRCGKCSPLCGKSPQLDAANRRWG